MDRKEIEIFVHAAAAKPQVIAATPDEILRDVLIRAGVLKADSTDLLVFVGECDDARHEGDDVEDGEDRHETSDIASSLHDLKVAHHHHVHVHKCRRIAVEVHFGGKTKKHRFSPATTVGVATAWARRKFRLDPGTVSEYVLQLCKSTDQPRPDKHLGELVKGGDCSLCFDLVKEVTPQG